MAKSIKYFFLILDSRNSNLKTKIARPNVILVEYKLCNMVTTQTGIRSMYAGIYQMHTTYLYNLVFTWFVPWWDFSMNIHLHMIMSFSPSYIMQVCWKNLYVVIVLQSKYFDMTLPILSCYIEIWKSELFCLLGWEYMIFNDDGLENWGRDKSI